MDIEKLTLGELREICDRYIKSDDVDFGACKNCKKIVIASANDKYSMTCEKCDDYYCGSCSPIYCALMDERLIETRLNGERVCDSCISVMDLDMSEKKLGSCEICNACIKETQDCGGCGQCGSLFAKNVKKMFSKYATIKK
jgi:hypothetical protein